jgi:hypothetical protein
VSSCHSLLHTQKQSNYTYRAGFAITGVQPLSVHFVHFAKQRKSFVCALWDIMMTQSVQTKAVHLLLQTLTQGIENKKRSKKHCTGVYIERKTACSHERETFAAKFAPLDLRVFTSGGLSIRLINNLKSDWSIFS